MKTIAPLFRIFLSLLTVTLLLQTLSWPYAFAEGNLPSVDAQSYCLMDARDQTILAERNSEIPLPMASTTKIMTALVILESCDVNARVCVSPEAAGIEGSSIYLQANESIRVMDLLYALMLESANDAAVALALFCCDNTEAFADKMNQKAKELGMTNSHFCNPSGLSEEEHKSSSEDMAILTAYAMKNPLFRQITATKNIRVPMENSGEYRYLSNHNRLLHKYSHCIGGKTGYTIAAGRCLVSVSHKDGVELIAVTLNDSDDWNDHIQMFEYGFSLYSSVSLCNPGELSYRLPVVGGVANSVTVENKVALALPLRNKNTITIQWELPFFLYAPVIPAGEEESNVPLPIGRAVFLQNGAYLAEVWLYPADSVADYTPPTLWERFLMFFGWKKE